MNAQEQEELDLAVAISLSEQDSKPCRQSDAFLTSNVLPNRNRNERLTIDGSTNASNLQQLPRSSGDSAPLNESYSDSRGALYNDGRSGRSAPMAESPSSSSASYNHRQNRTPTGKESQPSRASSVLNFGLPSRLARQLYKEISPSFNSQLICPTCNKGIFGAYVNVMDGHYHPECFRCSACNGQLVGSHFSKGDPPLPYHQECAEEIFGERCCVCDAILRGQYLRHPFFQEEIYCLGHQGIRQCCACNRKEPFRSSRGTTHRAKEGFTELHDGRVSCMDCISTAIIDSAEALPLYLEAVDFMERVLGLLIPKGMREVPILAVDLPSLNEQQKNNNTGFHLAEAESTTRGLTLSSIGQVRHMTSGSIQIDRSGYITVKPAQMHSIEQVREVTAVLVLFGLPRDLTASILAHEAMHVWMRLTKNIPYPLPLKVEEGMCQVVARGYLEDLTTASHNSDTGEAKGDRAGEEKEGKGQSGPSPATSRGGTSVFTTALNRLEYCPVISSTPDQAQISKSKKSRALRAYFSSQIETDCSEVYGAGFREAQECCSALGLEIVLEVIRETSKLPKM